MGAGVLLASLASTPCNWAFSDWSSGYSFTSSLYAATPFAQLPARDRISARSDASGP